METIEEKEKQDPPAVDAATPSVIAVEEHREPKEAPETPSQKKPAENRKAPLPDVKSLQGKATKDRNLDSYYSRKVGDPDSVGKDRFRRRRRVLDVRKVTIDYKKPEVLERFISKTGKILPRRLIGVTPLVQRKIAREIKRARHIGLLPYSHR